MNKQKRHTHRQRVDWQLQGGGQEGGGIEPEGKRTHEHEQQGRDCGQEGSTWRINGNRRNKNKFKKIFFKMTTANIAIDVWCE